MYPSEATSPAPTTFVLRALLLVPLLSLALAQAGLAQVPLGEAPWFGLPLPPGFEPHVSPAIIGDRGPVPATVPQGEEAYAEFDA